MADLSVTPVAASVKPPQVTSLADMVNLARGAQAFRQAEEMNPMLLLQQQNVVTQGQQEVKRGAITLGQAEQADKERLAVQNLMATNPNAIMTNGMFDPAKLNDVIPKLAPYTGSEYITKFSTLGKAQNELMDSSTKLSQGDKAVIAGPLGVLGRSGVADPKVYLGELDYLAKQHEGNPNMLRLIKAQRDIISQLPPGEHVAQGAIRASESLLAPTQQREAFTPQAGTINTGASILPTTVQPSVGGSKPTISVGGTPLAQVQVGPGQRMEATGEKDMNNNPIYQVKDVNGQVIGTVVVPAGVPQSWLPGGGGQPVPAPAPAPAPGQAKPPPAANRTSNVPVVVAPTNAPVRLPPGETSDTLTAAQNIRLNANRGAAEVPLQQFNSNQIIKLADDVITGKGAGLLSSLSGGYAAIPWTSDQATNLNQLGHYMSLQTASLAKTAGLSGTDAANRLAGEMSGTTEWTAPAIKQTARVNRALSTGTELFNMGVENAFKRTNNPFSAREFQNKWAATTDINAIRLYDALKNNDKEAIAEVVRQAGGQNSAGYKALVNKIGQMNALIKGQ